MKLVFDRNEIGKSLAAFRQQNGLSQSELARRTGLSQQSISRWENNVDLPNVLDLIVLSKFYKMTVDELIGAEYAEWIDDDQ